MKVKVTALFHDFFESEKASGLILLFVTSISLILTNTSFQGYVNLWNMKVADHDLVHWINDGLMAIYFLLIGLELEREIYKGELSDIKSAALPVFGAVGGMIIPAGIFLLFNTGKATSSGAGIPMATDIAFAIAILSLLGNRVPISLKIFLTALAVIDDLGAIIVIAVFYTASLQVINLLIALGIFIVLLIFNRMKIHMLLPYLIGGVAMWYFMLHSGVHATVTGVLLAFAIPFGDGGEKTLSSRMQKFLHLPCAFIILPLFAMANTCVMLNDFGGITHSHSIGIIAGLTIGKPVGIALLSFIGVALGLCNLPSDLNWKHIIGVGFLGGIGFTMSIFITLLAFDDAYINSAKMAILIASVISGLTGYLILRLMKGDAIRSQDSGVRI